MQRDNRVILWLNSDGFSVADRKSAANFIFYSDNQLLLRQTLVKQISDDNLFASLSLLLSIPYFTNFYFINMIIFIPKY